MRQTPIVSGVALLSLALGIGANVAIFSLVNALILKALPIHEPERLVQLQLTDTNPRNHTTSFTNPQWEYLRDHQDIFTGVTAAEEADRRGSEPIAILSYGFWQREYGGDRAVLGRPISLDGNAFTIAGVTPPEFFGVRVGTTFDVMIPLTNEAIIRGVESSLDRRSSWWLSMFARLAPGQTMAQAESRLRALQPRLRRRPCRRTGGRRIKPPISRTRSGCLPPPPVSRRSGSATAGRYMCCSESSAWC